MTVRHKLLALVAFIVLSTAALFFLNLFTVEKVLQFEDALLKINEVKVRKLKLIDSENRFIIHKSDQTLSKFDSDLVTYKQALTELQDRIHQIGLQPSILSDLNRTSESYATAFSELAEQYHTIGFDQNSGLRGKLRSAVKSVETDLRASNNLEILAQVLQLRRVEKDFMLRFDKKYVDSFAKEHDKIKEIIAAQPLSTAETDTKLRKLETYRQGFLLLTQGYEKAGLSEKSGLRANLISHAQASNEHLQRVADKVDRFSEEGIQELQTLSAAIAISLITIALVISALIAKSIIGPITLLNVTMNTARKNKDLTLTFQPSTQDEFATIAENFNGMMEEFRRVIEHVYTASNALNQSAAQVSNISQQTHQGFAAQRDEVLQVSSAIREMNTAMKDISTSTEMSANTAQNAQSNAVTSQTAIRKTIENMRHIATDAEQSSKAIIDLEKESNAISAVLDVIKGIAEQTNLLALNAAIEAARAGDSGRGFAVVADEVRALAARTQTSTVEIEEMIASLQNQTTNFSNMIRSLTELSLTSANDAQGCIKSIDNIIEGAHHIVDMTTQVASAVEEQSAVAHNITSNTDNINEIVEHSSLKVNENALASDDVSKQATLLKETISQFKVR